MSEQRTPLIAAALGVMSSVAIAQPYEVAPELWDRPRTASAIIAQDALKRAVTDLLARPDARLVIHHAPGQEPLLQAEELKSWLGALAVDTRRIVLRGDLAHGTPMKIEVTP